MLEHAKRLVHAAESDSSVKTREAAFSRLRSLGLEDFGEVLWSMPNPELPRLSSVLPQMASLEVQRNWTGNTGHPLLVQTAEFVRSMLFNHAYITGKRVGRVLDYGCGYGRVMRLLYRYLDEDRVVGVDPWDVSVKICRDAGIHNVQQSEYLPVSLPVAGKFSLIYAFSVFTHTSKRATIQAMKALREYIAEDGMLAITIRPVEYWVGSKPEPAMVEEHKRSGFAFIPHDREPVDGDVTYGFTSMTTEWLAQNCPGWKLAAEDWTSRNPFQRYLYLTPT